MAGVAPEQLTTGPAAGGRTAARGFVVPRIRRGELLPPLVLALLTVLALIVAYSARPPVRIDLGDYYDTAFLNQGTSSGFHDREAGAISPGVTTPWPPASNQVELPGRRTGLWIATVQATPGQPDDVLKLTALAVNDVRVSIVRRTGDAFVALVPPQIATAERLRLELVPAVSGGDLPPAGTAGSVELAPAKTYRWSQGASDIHLPGLGRGSWQVTLGATVAHPDNRTVGATVAANGAMIATLPDRRELRQLHLFVPAALVSDGDLTLTIGASTYNDPRPLGVLVESVRVVPAGPVAWLPPSGSLASALVTALALYGSLRWMAGRTWMAAGLALATVLGLVWWLALSRYPAALMLPRLAILALWSLVLLAALAPLLAWAFRRAGVPLSTRMLHGLLLVFFAGYWIKAGGMLYPYFVGIDVAWHMERVQWIIDGRLPLLYGTNSPLNESTMPEAEWGANRPVIPYSPWFHMFATVFALSPLSMVLTANMVHALLDTSRVLLIALLGRKAGLNEREAFLAALLFAITPVTFLLLSWGNLPTASGMWWALFGTVYLVTAYARLDRLWPFLGLVTLLTVTFLIYTVTGVFVGLFMLLLTAGLWLRTPRTERRPVVALGLATLAAAGLATLIYYGQYIPPIIERTLPYFTRTAAPGSGATGVSYDPFGLYLEKYLWRMAYVGERGGGYGLLLTLPLGLLGWYWIRGRLIRTMLAAWLVVALLFLVAGARVSMVDKHLFFIVPALALGAGALFGRLWHDGRAGRLTVALCYLFTAAAALNLWIYRIVSVRQ